MTQVKALLGAGDMTPVEMWILKWLISSIYTFIFVQWYVIKTL